MTEEQQLRQRAQQLYDGPIRTEEEFLEFANIKAKLIKEYGWARGKKLPSGRYSYLER